MSIKVSVVEEKMKQLIYSAMLTKLQSEAGSINHKNTDGIYSPSRWWYDRHDTSLGGKILNTSGSMTVTDNNNSMTVTVNLDYTLRPR